MTWEALDKLRNEDATLRTHERNLILFFERSSWADFHTALNPLENFRRTNQAAGVPLVSPFVPEQDGSQSGTYRITPSTYFRECPI